MNKTKTKIVSFGTMNEMTFKAIGIFDSNNIKFLSFLSSHYIMNNKVQLY